MLKITGLILPFGYTDGELKEACAKRLAVENENIYCVKRLKEALITDGGTASCKVSAAVGFCGEDTYIIRRKDRDIERYSEPVYRCCKVKADSIPVVVGFGPAGIFAALTLAEAGLSPIVLERGEDIDSRTKKVAEFTSGGEFDRESNVQFGEGGAGAFSDGKLKPGAVDARKFKILSEFVAAGAPEEITYLDLPHIGTDRLRTAIKSIREKIISLGGDIRFSSKVTDILLSGESVSAVKYTKDGQVRELSCDDLIIATGHSARDTFGLLRENGVPFRRKNFGIGVRIEHPQALINRLIYKQAADRINRAASYHLVSHVSDTRTVYSFCMCPGGYVMAATGEPGAVVTNGMSEYSRNGSNANSALLVSVSDRDLMSDDAFAGIRLQEKIERTAFIAAGSNYHAPIQLLGDFTEERQSTCLGEVSPTYRPGTAFVPLCEYLPQFITDALRDGIRDMSEWLNGFYLHDAVLTGPETRSTSPVCIPRNTNCEADGFHGLYPCGEGAGYAGGIISSAVDGIICAEAVIGKYKQN